MFKRAIYKRLGLLFCISIIGIFWNCKSSDITDDENYTTDINKLEMLLEKEAYSIDIEAALPFVTASTQQVANALFLSRTGNTASRVYVGGDGHFIEIKNDSVKGDLPFFGERRLSGGPYGGRNGGIAFEGLPENFEKSLNKNKRKLEIKFSISQTGESSERYDVNLEIFPSKNAVVNINSTYKTSMGYTGNLRLENESQ
ncbi:DUF4251 domain-containing protein [Winogradskyella schleiferi]|uniref:DUF4251 domain-containing protein n=1 Tax=Winogradskyella schleiferi TaxID=2686078 RepID=UPI0015BE45D1|nr:DUF4251 domain-containing protein [Winogradskyella schleiferi]